jgi:hypothetical protein
MSKKNVPYWRVNQIVEELDGKVHYSTLLDSRGIESKRITIIYTEENDSSSLQ